MATTNFEELIIALRTDHGIPKGRHAYALGSLGNLDGDDEPGAVCAFGNIATDYVKRLGLRKTSSTISSLAGNIHEAFNRIISDALNQHMFDRLPDEFLIHNINDNTSQTFDEMAEGLRAALVARNIPLDTPIEFRT